MSRSASKKEPGQPWLKIRGIASGRDDLMCEKCNEIPSISTRKCGLLHYTDGRIDFWVSVQACEPCHCEAPCLEELIPSLAAFERAGKVERELEDSPIEPLLDGPPPSHHALPRSHKLATRIFRRSLLPILDDLFQLSELRAIFPLGVRYDRVLRQVRVVESRLETLEIGFGEGDPQGFRDGS